MAAQSSMIRSDKRFSNMITRMRIGILLFIVTFILMACSSAPPKKQSNLCSIFGQKPDWYDYAKRAQAKWGIPKHILMSFVRHESSYKGNAKTPFDWFLFVPLGRKSSAKGYAQAKNPVWKEYKEERGGFFRSRGDMEDALDFIGWYNNKTHKQLGISKWDAKNLYLAYHEGRGGYKRGSYKKKPDLVKYANKVSATAGEYGAQLKRCEDEFNCSKWNQVWPLCR